jgi:hypothetical protein
MARNIDKGTSTKAGPSAPGHTSRMSERDILLRWLAGAAARLCVARRLRDAGMLGCALFGLLALHQVVRALIPLATVVGALTPLFVLTALGCTGLFAWRLSRRVTLAEAAGAADARAGLKDEFKSAYWLGERNVEVRARQALVPLLLRRAANDAQRLDARRLFPLQLPSSMAAALGLALLTAGLGWLAPRIAYPTADAPAEAAAPASASATPGPQPRREAEEAQALPVAGERERAAWSALDELVAGLRGGGDVEDFRRAVAARDAQRAAALLAAMQRREAAAALQGPAAHPEDEQMSPALAQGILERLHALMESGGDSVLEARTDRPAPAQRTAHLTEQLREEVADAQRDKGGRHSEGETHLNDMLRAISRSSIGERQVVQGDGELGQDHGRTSLGGGAMGRRVGVSRAGGDGERPQGNPGGDAESEPVLGARTERLQAQLQKVRVESADDARSEESGEEDFYAATRAQAAQVDYRAVHARQAAGAEAVVAGDHAPLAYQEAVKQYSLMQHRRER